MKNNCECALKNLDLVSARKIITTHARQTQGEDVALQDALGRIPVGSLRARKQQPGYDQSTRDGFVVSDRMGMVTKDGCRFRIEGEVQAGNIEKRTLANGEACRITTGGLIPSRGKRVILQEESFEGEGWVFIPDTVWNRPGTFIRKKGSDIQKGRVVVKAGTPIMPDHLVLLAATGYTTIAVHRKPRVSFFCTGNELVALPSQEEEGLKVSGNRYLLNGLIRLSGAIPEDHGTVADTMQDLAIAFSRIDCDAIDVIITTGGMGPGRYDLLEESFVKAGGKVLYRSLQVRPGKATLFGILGKVLFFGLPGPPPAVRALFNELVGPSLFYLQGMKKHGPLEVKAVLHESIILKQKGQLNLKGGVLTIEKGTVSVRLAGKIEVPSCFILFPGYRRSFKKGELIDVHLAGSTHSFWGS